MSRDRRNEYEHLVPQQDFQSIVEKLFRIKKLQKDFKSEDVQEGLELPSYQTYAVLSLMRHFGFIEAGQTGLLFIQFEVLS